MTARSLSLLLALCLLTATFSGASAAQLNSGACHVRDLQTTVTQQHVRFFLYRLPPEMAKRVRDQCDEITHGLWDGFMSEANPIGRFLNKWDHRPALTKSCSHGDIYFTNQYATSTIWRQQAISSPLRVFDVRKADIVLVDLVDDLCLSAAFNPATSTDGPALNKAALPLIPSVMDLVLKHQNQTRLPHLVPLGRMDVQYMHPLDKPGILRYPGIERLNFLSIDISDWKGVGINDPRYGPPGGMANLSYHNVVPVPYTSTLHLQPHDKYFSSVDALRSKDSTPDFQCVVARKTLLAATAFWARLPLRTALRDQCQAAGGSRCQHVEVLGFERAEKNLLAIHDAYAKAWFCFQPHGDTHARRSFVDCILQDSIPVIFSNWTLNAAPFYDWIDPSEYMIVVPHDITQGLLHLGMQQQQQQQQTNLRNSAFHPDALDILGYLERRVPMERRIRMLKTIYQLKHVYQASLQPVHQLVRFDQLHEVHCLDDAFTASFKAALRSMCRRGQLPPARCRIPASLPAT